MENQNSGLLCEYVLDVFDAERRIRTGHPPECNPVQILVSDPKCVRWECFDDICPLQYQDVSTASLTAVKSYVLIASVWVKSADALLIAEET